MPILQFTIIMSREKTITLYSRNGIRIIKTINIDTKKYHNPVYIFEERSRVENLDNFEHISSRKSYYETVKCESKLGFYYYKTRYVSEDPSKNYVGKSVTYKKYIIWLDGTKYELEYPTSFKSSLTTVCINKYDNRPWDIVPGYKGIPDHFITALYKEVMKFIDIVYEYENVLNFKKSSPKYIRWNILFDLFGNENGPQQQPNDIKILSHGFDLKESFRKRKES